MRIKGSSFGVYDAVRRDITKYLDKHLDQVIARDLNLICEILGKGGEGKSMIAVYIAKKLKDAQIKHKKCEDAPIRFNLILMNLNVLLI